jgi:hypothetical protein
MPKVSLVHCLNSRKGMCSVFGTHLYAELAILGVYPALQYLEENIKF